MNPKELSKIFCEMNAGNQKEFLREVATIFNSWGLESANWQVNCMTSYMDKPTKEFILRLGEFVK